MNNIFIDINVLDHTGSPTTSAYALSSTPLLFYPEYTILDDEKNAVVWDFGDGTISKQTSAYKFYNFPGEYIVNMVLFNCVNNAIISTYQKTITVYDFLPLTFSLNTTNSLSAKCGQASEKFILTATYPVYQSPISIFYSISGSNSIEYWEVEDNKYSHLENTYNIWEIFYNNSIGSFQYRDIEKITPNVVSVYARISNNDIVICDESDTGSFFVGMSGTKEFYFKDDLPSESVELYLFFDKTKYNYPERDNYIDNLNNLGITIPFKVIDNEPYYLSITSNGLDGEHFIVDSFNISNIKFYNTQIPFVIRTKDESGYSFKNTTIISLSDISFDVYSDTTLLGVSSYSISSLNHTLSAQNYNGAFRGYITFTNNTYPLENVTLSALVSLSGYGDYSGTTSEFNVYPSNFYDIYKKNEDFDAEQTLKDLIFQEILVNDTVLFEDFFGSVFGDDNSDHEGISLKIYEKIANFVQNTQDITTSELEFLNSMANYVGYNDINEEKYVYPEKIKRLMDLLSINTTKLLGTENKFNEDFNTRGYTSKIDYGKNLGPQISTETYQLTAGYDIIALEKFSNTYTRLNTYQPVSAVGSQVYDLSAYTSDWGWPLVLPQPFDPVDFEKYYLFFEHNDTYDNTLLGGVVDFLNSKTTIPRSSTHTILFEDGGIYDNLFLNTLYHSLSLIS